MAVWERRQRGIVALLLVHGVALAGVGVARGYGIVHSVLEGGFVAMLAVLAMHPHLSIRMRSATATLGLISSSAILVHLSGGVVEAHFHFFAMIGIITLYQDWVPFGLAIAYVAAHHGIASTLFPRSVFNHYAALNNPWKWALIHALFVLGASAANLYAWRFNEEAAAETEAYRARHEESERRRQSALEINDNIVQGLAVISSALALGHQDLATAAADRTIAAARTIITDLLGDEDAPIVPGSLRRGSAVSG